MPAGRPRFVASLLFAALCAGLSAQTFINWTGASGNFSDSTKWSGGLPSSQTIAVFSDTVGGVVTVNAPASVQGIQFTAPGAYSFDGTSLLTVGSSGITLVSPGAGQSFRVPMAFLPGSTPVNVNSSAPLNLFGTIQVPSGATVVFGGTGSASGGISGVITGAGAVRVQSGSWGLSGANVFTGGTTLTGGSLRLGASGALPSGGSLVFDPSAGFATLDLNGQNTAPLGSITFRGSGGAASQVIGAGTLNLGGSVVYEGGFQPGSASISGGTLALGSASRTFVVGDSGSATTELSIGSVITGTGGIVKQGPGALGLTNSFNLFSGPVIVNAGSLNISATGALPAGVAVTVDATGGSATLALGGTSQSVSALTLGGANRIQAGLNSVQIGTGGILTLGSSTAGNLTVYGSGAWPGARIGDSFSTSAGQLNFNAGGTINVVRNVPAATGVVDLEVTVALAGSGTVQKTGSGALLLEGSGALLTGTLNVVQGTVLLGTSFAPSTTAAGGPIIVGTGGVVGAGAGVSSFKPAEISVGKNVSLQSGAQLGTWEIDQGIRLNLAGSVTVQPAANSTTAVVKLGGYVGTVVSGLLQSSSAGSTLTLANANVGARGLLAVLSPIDASIGTVNVDGAGLIVSALPSSPLTSFTAANGGYIGVAPGAAGTAPPTLQSIANRSAASFNGTFGLDSPRDAAAPSSYSDSIDLSRFGPGVTLGSMTGAIMTGTITPSGSAYAFGNGGGLLVLAGNASLTNAPGGAPRSVQVVSSTALKENSLRLLLRTSNSFSGGISVLNSVVVFDAPGALPAASGPLSLGAGSYVGFSERAGMDATSGFRWLLNPANLPAAGLNAEAVIGLDSTQFIADKLGNPNGTTTAVRLVPDRIDLSLLAQVGLGTFTQTTLLGTVVGQTAGGTRSLRLVGFDGGQLEVRSRLSDANAKTVTLGGSSPLSLYGTVVLGAQNTYSGGTTLLSGTVVAATSQRNSGGAPVSGPLGVGSVTVPANAQSPTLAAPSYAYTGSTNTVFLLSSVTLGNNFLLGSRLAVGTAPDPSVSSVSFSVPLILNGTITDSAGTGGLDVYSDVKLTAANTFSGGVNLYNGTIFIGSSSSAAGGPLGTGTLTISSAGGGFSRGLATLGTQTIANPVVFDLAGQSNVSRFGSGALTLSGPVALNSEVAISNSTDPLYLTGVVSGSGPLRAYGSGPLVLNPTAGANTFSGGISTYGGTVILGSAASVPAGPNLISGSGGYIGFAGPAGNVQSDFLARFDRFSTTGALGFDSLVGGKLNYGPTSGVTVFNDAIDLTGFASSLRLGSASTAILSGKIIPPGNMYAFGGGGGWLELRSSLPDVGTGGTSFSVSSAGASGGAPPLLVRLASTGNTFTGGAEANGAALIFGTGSLPATGNFTVLNGGYLGTEAASGQAAIDAFLGRAVVGSSGVVIGFDTPPGAPAVSVSGALDLTKIPNASGIVDPLVFLGTATRATLASSITPPASAVYRFAGYKGGQLTVATAIPAGSVQVGDSSAIAFHGNPLDPSVLSSVTLSTASTYSGGTTLASGQLLLGNSSALGTGPLNVTYPAYGPALPAVPFLGAVSDGLTFANAVSLQSGSLGLTGAASFTLSGAISGTGGLTKTGTGTVTLTGVNTFTGGLSMEQGTLVFASVPGAKLGYLSFGAGANATTRFLESYELGGLFSDSAAARVEVAAGKTLTFSPVATSATVRVTALSQSVVSYAGTFSPVVPGGAFNLVFGAPVPTAGASIQVVLSGQSSYAGTTSIRTGSDLVAANSAAFGTSSVSLDGGRLALPAGVNLANPLSITAGTLAGEGSFTTASTIPVGAGVVLAPGSDLPGTLSFAAATGFNGAVLSLLGGGSYSWKIGDAADTGAGWDRVIVTGAGGATVAASPVSPFKVTMSPVGAGGLLAGTIGAFDPLIPYAWPILTASSITGFASGAFVVDSSAFATLAPDYKFSVGLVTDPLGSSLVLNYNPAAVPEPSTWVMLLTGAGFGVIWLGRRRRR